MAHTVASDEAVVSLNSPAIAAAIAALSVSGVTIKDLSGIPQQVQPRECPILYPSPSGWNQGGSAELSQKGPATFGTPTTRYWEFDRTYNYTYLHAPVGSGRGLYEHYTAMTTNEDAIMSILTTLDIATVDVNGVKISAFGTVQDPAGSSFYGYTVSITMRERLNQ